MERQNLKQNRPIHYMIGIEASYPFSYQFLVRFLSKISGRSNEVTGYIFIHSIHVPRGGVMCILMHALNPYCFLFRFSLSSEGEEVGTPHTISHYFLSDSSLGSY